MMFWVLASLLTALVTGLVVTPLYRAHYRLAMVLLFVIPLVALSFYVLSGNPDLANL